MYRIPRSDLCMSDAMPFNQHWEARIPISLEELGNVGQALQECFTNFRPGDLINIISFESRDWRRLRELASYRIASCEDNIIEAVAVTELIKISEAKKHVSEPQPVTLQVIKTGSAYEVRDSLGNSIEVFVSQVQAEDYIKINSPKAVAKEVSEDRSKWTIGRGFQGKWVVRSGEGEIVKEFRKKDEAEEYLGIKNEAA